MQRKHRIAIVVSLACAGLVASAASPANADTQFAGNLAIYRVGDGSAALSSAGAAVFIDQFSPTGTLVNSTAIPSSLSASSNALVGAGSATAEGYLTRSAAGNQLSFFGYNTSSGTAGVAGSATTAIPRIVGILDTLGNYSSPLVTTGFSGANPRGAATVDGSTYLGVGSSTGVISFPNSGGASTAGTVVSATSTNNRAVNIFNGNLMFSTQTGTRGIYAFSGIPSAAGTTATLLVPTGTAGAANDFAVSPSGLTIYVADERAVASSGGIQRYDSTDGVTFALSYTLGTGSGSTVGARGLAVDFSGAAPIVYATTTESAANRLVSVVDLGVGSVATTLATAGANTAFRGMEFTVPEPGSLSVVAAAGLLAARRRRNTR